MSKQQINIEQLKEEVLNTIYPVGSLYINSTNSTNPGTLLGFGTWVQVTDKMIMAVGSTYPAGSNGGAAAHTHGLTDGRADIAATGTDLRLRRTIENFSSTVRFAASGGVTENVTMGYKTMLSGSTDSESNLPPYETAYIWKRTA